MQGSYGLPGLLCSTLKGFVFSPSEKIQSIACVLGTFWFVWILLLVSMKKYPKQKQN